MPNSPQYYLHNKLGINLSSSCLYIISYTALQLKQILRQSVGLHQLGENGFCTSDSKLDFEHSNIPISVYIQVSLDSQHYFNYNPRFVHDKLQV